MTDYPATNLKLIETAQNSSERKPVMSQIENSLRDLYADELPKEDIFIGVDMVFTPDVAQMDEQQIAAKINQDFADTAKLGYRRMVSISKTTWRGQQTGCIEANITLEPSFEFKNKSTHLIARKARADLRGLSMRGYKINLLIGSNLITL